MTGRDTNEVNRIGSTKTSFEILHQLQRDGPSRLSEIANELNLAESTTHRHLNTLCDLRYVSRDGKKYQIGLRFLRLGQRARTRDPAYSAARRHVDDLAEELEERVQFVVEDHGLGVYLHMATGSKAVRAGFDVGHQIHLHCSSAGKSILANQPRVRADEILDRWGMPSHTENTITERETLFEELERVRERDIAFNREEHVQGVNGVAVPIKRGESVLGALAVAGPSHRLDGERLEDEIPSRLLAAANEFEVNVTYSSPRGSDEHIVE